MKVFIIGGAAKSGKNIADTLIPGKGNIDAAHGQVAENHVVGQAQKTKQVNDLVLLDDRRKYACNQDA